MTDQHTPGPWHYSHREGADGMYRTMVFSEQHGGIATCDWTPKHCGNGVTATYREANARLISAAPDLLAVAFDYLEVLGEIDGPCECGEPECRTTRLRAAIAKATGSQS